MRIGFVIPPAAFLIDDRAFLFLGIVQVATYARSLGCEVEILDLTGHSRECCRPVHDEECAAETLDESMIRVAELAARCDAVGCYSMAALHCFVSRLLPAIRAGNEKCKAILGGPHASTAPERCAAEGWDYVVASDQGGGGGEAGFLEVLRRLSLSSSSSAPVGDRCRVPPTGAPPLRLLSVMRKASCGTEGVASERIIRAASRDAAFSGARNDYSNDRFPHPDRSLVDFESYRYVIDGRRYASVVTQAGCPYACNFCAHHEGYRKLVLRSPGHVRAEIDEIKARWPWVGGIMFYDDEVNLRGDFWDFLGVIKEAAERHDLRLRGFFKCHKRWMADDLFARMKAAGFDHLCTGAESAHPDVMRHIGKGATVEDNTDFVRLCVKHGIKPKVFTMIGQVGERPDTAEALARWLESMAGEGLSDADVTVMTPTAGTPLFEDSERWLATGLISFDKRELESNAEAVNYKGRPGEYKSFVSTPWLSREDIVHWRDEVERRFRRAARLPALAATGKDDG